MPQRQMTVSILVNCLTFSKLVSGVFIRLLLDGYQRQFIRMEWNGHFSESLRVFNLVKQGSIMSSILFNLYLDVLLDRIKKSWVSHRKAVSWLLRLCRRRHNTITKCQWFTTNVEYM